MSDEPTSPLNDQIKDAVEQINAILTSDGGAATRAISYQLMAHSVALAMYNTVQQQQQAYILQNAIVSAAAKAALESDPKEAIALAKEGLNTSQLSKNLAELKGFMDELNAAYGDLDLTAKKKAGKKD